MENTAEREGFKKMTERERELEIRRLNMETAKKMNQFGCEPLTPEQEVLFDRYVRGEIDDDELESEIHRYCERLADSQNKEA